MTIESIHEAYAGSLQFETGDDRLTNFLYFLYGKPPTFLISNLAVLRKNICPKVDDRFRDHDEDPDVFWQCKHQINYDKTERNLNKIPGTIVFRPEPSIYLLINDDFVYDCRECECYLYKEVFDLIDKIETTEKKASIEFVTGVSQNGINTTSREIKLVDHEDILSNYNDDLPDKELIDFLRSNDSGLVVLRGLPGTGKSFYIRSLINHLRDKKFVAMDVSDFGLITQNKVALTNFKERILIIEDCEELLKDRNRSHFNTSISALLNMTDGLFGDFLNFKIICTFNADLSSIDTALLRKGRIKVLYEFKELSQEKADALRKKLGKKGGTSNILCDIYNEDSTGVTDQKKQTKRIGF